MPKLGHARLFWVLRRRGSGLCDPSLVSENSQKKWDHWQAQREKGPDDARAPPGFAPTLHDLQASLSLLSEYSPGSQGRHVRSFFPPLLQSPSSRMPNPFLHSLHGSHVVMPSRAWNFSAWHSTHCPFSAALNLPASHFAHSRSAVFSLGSPQFGLALGSDPPWQSVQASHFSKPGAMRGSGHTTEYK